jgi:hypothetical protein
MIFVESPWFATWRGQHLSDEAFRALQNELLTQPLSGDLIPGGEGLRKLRLALPGRGKRGGARVIYYYWRRADRIYLLLAYAKNEQTDLTRDQARRLKAAMNEDLSNG